MGKGKEACTGCMACRNICPAQAIGAKRNPNGFIMPVVDNRLCINCGQCEKVCPLTGMGQRRFPQKAYAMYHL